MDLTISIVNHNTGEFLKHCLQSIFADSVGFEYEVVVVDNASTDGSVDMVKSDFPQVRLAQKATNDGFAHSNNDVLRTAGSRYVLVLNPDIEVLPGALDGMLRHMDTHPDVGVLGCKLLNMDRSVQFSCREYPDALTIMLRGLFVEALFPNATRFRRYMMADWDHADVAEVDWVMGSCMLLRKEALDAVGPFDERFFMYYEDVDLCLRMWKKWKVCYYPKSCMIHRHLQESHRLGALRLRWKHAQSAWRFFRKHGPFPKRDAIGKG